MPYLYGGSYEGQFVQAPLVSLVDTTTGKTWDVLTSAWVDKPSGPKSHLQPLVMISSEDVPGVSGAPATRLGCVVFNVPTKLNLYGLILHDPQGVRVGGIDIVQPSQPVAASSSGFRGAISIQFS